MGGGNMAMTIFRELPCIETTLEIGKDNDELYSQRLAVFKRFKDFVASGVYTQYRHKNAFLDVLFSEHSPTVKIDKLISHKVGIAESTVRLSRLRMSEEVYKALGHDIVKRILRGDSKVLAEIQREICVCEGVAANANLVPIEVVDLVKYYSLPHCPEFELSECKREVEFLKQHNLSRVRKLLAEGDLDSDKLCYLIQALEDSKSPHHKQLLKLVL
jgi:hypothetical protein